METLATLDAAANNLRRVEESVEQSSMPRHDCQRRSSAAIPWHSGSDQFMLTFLLGLIIEECARPESLPSTTYIFAVFEFVSACFTIFTFFV